MGGGGGFGFSQSSSKPKDLTPREFREQRGLVAGQLVNRIEGGGPTLGGPFAAPVTAAEQSGLDFLQGDVFGQGGLGAAQDAALRGALSGGEQNPFLSDAITAATRPLIENEQLNELRSRALFTGAGQKIQNSSAFTEDRTRSLRDTERAIGDISTNLSFQDVIRRTEQRLQAVNLANARFAEQREAITSLALPRLVEQFGLDGANEELRRRITSMEDALTELGNLSSPTVANESQSISVSGNVS